MNLLQKRELIKSAIGTLCTAAASLLFALMDTRMTYWAFGFPAATIVVVGADFVYAAGTLFIAKISLPHEQSLAGGLFQTMIQVREHIPGWPDVL